MENDEAHDVGDGYERWVCGRRPCVGDEEFFAGGGVTHYGVSDDGAVWEAVGRAALGVVDKAHAVRVIEA